MRLGAAAAAAAAAAVALRLLVWANLPAGPETGWRPDTSDYMALARSLRAGEGFSREGVPEAARVPGYPLFLAAHGALSERPRAVLLTQIALDGASAALTAAAAAALGAPALAAGLLYALDPVVAGHSLLLLSETPFTFLLLVSAYALIRAGSPPARGWLALAGVALGAGVLTRPIAAYLWLPWAAACLWTWGRGRWRDAALFAAASAALPALWCARNAVVFGSFALSSITGVNFLFWEAPAVRGAAEGLTLEAARERVAAEYAAAHPSPEADPFAESRRRAAFALREMAERPSAVARVHLAAAAKLFLGPGLDLQLELLRPERRLERAESSAHAVSGAGTWALARGGGLPAALLGWSLLWLGACYALAALGALRLRRADAGRAVRGWLVPLAYLAAISTGGWCYYRFRVPLWPFVAVAAAAGLAVLREASSGRRRP